MENFVEVTADHIKNGVRRDKEFCAFALALQDAGYIEPKVNEKMTWFKPDGIWTCKPLSLDAILFIADFDEGKDVQPQQIEIL